MAVLGYTLLGILALLVLLLCIPVRLRACYRTGGEAGAWLSYLFFRFDLAGGKPKTGHKEEKPKESAQEKPKKPGKEKKPLEAAEMLSAAVDLLGSLKGGAKMLLKNFKVTTLRIFLVVAEGDAAETAIAYGRCNAAVYSAWAAAKHLLRLPNPQVDIRPDFTGENGMVDLEIKARLIPIVAVAAAVRVACAFLVRTLRRKKEESRKPAATAANDREE